MAKAGGETCREVVEARRTAVLNVLEALVEALPWPKLAAAPAAKIFGGRGWRLIRLGIASRRANGSLEGLRGFEGEGHCHGKSRRTTRFHTSGGPTRRLALAKAGRRIKH